MVETAAGAETNGNPGGSGASIGATATDDKAKNVLITQ